MENCVSVVPCKFIDKGKLNKGFEIIRIFFMKASDGVITILVVLRTFLRLECLHLLCNFYSIFK